jgi:glycogen(starch) synthase
LKHDFEPDVIHINFSGYTAFFQVATAANYPTPTVIALHSDLTGLKVGPGTTMGKLFRLADRVTGISRATLASACQMIPGIAGRSSVIHGCIGEGNPAPTPLPFKQPCILGIGRLAREKGFDLLIEAFSFIAARYPNLALKIIGDGSERPVLEKQAIELGLKARVEFAGSIPNEVIPEYINRACLVVVPSRYQEPFGLVAVEAARMARPVVAANVGGLAEIVVDRETGLLVEMDNSRALADAIVFLVSQPERAEEMGRAGRVRVEREFSLLKYVDAYDSLYRQMVDPRPLLTGKSQDGHAT